MNLKKLSLIFIPAFSMSLMGMQDKKYPKTIRWENFSIQFVDYLKKDDQFMVVGRPERNRTPGEYKAFNRPDIDPTKGLFTITDIQEKIVAEHEKLEGPYAVNPGENEYRKIKFHEKDVKKHFTRPRWTIGTHALLQENGIIGHCTNPHNVSSPYLTTPKLSPTPLGWTTLASTGIALAGITYWLGLWGKR